MKLIEFKDNTKYDCLKENFSQDPLNDVFIHIAQTIY